MEKQRKVPASSPTAFHSPSHPLWGSSGLPHPASPHPSYWPGPGLRHPGSLGEAQDKQIFPDVAVVEEGCEGKGGCCRERAGVLQVFRRERGRSCLLEGAAENPGSSHMSGGDPGRRWHSHSHEEGIITCARERSSVRLSLIHISEPTRPKR